MKRVLRLLSYMRPYSLYLFFSVLLMVVFAAMAALRVLLFKPIIDNVLSPKTAPDQVLVYPIRDTHYELNLQFLIPHHFHNAWTVVAVALVGSAIVKSICDYAGTLLAKQSRIRDDHRSAQRSLQFDSRPFDRVLISAIPADTLISTLINDVERVQAAIATVLIDFLQQFFTLLVLIGVVIITGGTLAWILLVFVPIIVLSSRKVGRKVRKTTRRGQDKLAEIQNIVQETISGHGIVKVFGTELLEMQRFRRAANRLLSANLRTVAVQAISSPLMDALGAVLLALLLFVGRNAILHGTTAGVLSSPF